MSRFTSESTFAFSATEAKILVRSAPVSINAQTVTALWGDSGRRMSGEEIPILTRGPSIGSNLELMHGMREIAQVHRSIDDLLHGEVTESEPLLARYVGPHRDIEDVNHGAIFHQGEFAQMLGWESRQNFAESFVIKTNLFGSPLGHAILRPWVLMKHGGLG